MGRLHRFLGGWIGGLLLPMAVSGCAIPDYHQPQGFSSTYYQELQKVAATPAPPPLVKVTPPPAARIGGPNDLLPVPLPVETAEEVPEVVEPSEDTVAASNASWWSWIRRPLTIRRNSTTAEDAENDADDSTDPPIPP